LSIEKAAERCGLNSGNWVRWEDGALPRDKVDVAQAVSDGLGIDFDWMLLGGPLLGPRGRPVRSAGSTGDTVRYRHLPSVRPPDRRPHGHPDIPIGMDGGRRPRRRVATQSDRLAVAALTPTGL